MIAAFLFALAVQAPDDDTIVLRHARPAQNVSMTKNSTCGDMVFEITYTQTQSGVVGAILVKDGERTKKVADAQASLFDHLSYVDGTVVNCGDETLPSRIIVTGVDKETGEVDQLYQLGYLSDDGFSTISGPKN